MNSEVKALISRLQACERYNDTTMILQNLTEDASGARLAKGVRIEVGPIGRIKRESEALSRIEALDLSFAPKLVEVIEKDDFGVLVTRLGTHDDQSVRQEEFGYEPDFRLSVQAKQRLYRDVDMLTNAELYNGAVHRYGCWYVHNATDQLVVLPWFRLTEDESLEERESCRQDFKRMVELS